MSEITADQTPEPSGKKGFSGMQVLAIVLGVMLLTAAVTTFIVWRYVFVTKFQPVTLSEKEQQRLDSKLAQIGVTPAGAEQTLEPEAYSEEGASREVQFSERELNALLARNTDLANRLAVDLSQDLASAKLLIPLDPDFPILGGKTLRVNAGLELAFRNGRPMAALRGVSVMGVPLPNAWLGNLKNVDLVSEFGGDGGFWRTFAAGVEFLEVRDSQLTLKLKE